MDKLRKIGLSALAGTLASFSASAGEMSVSGSAEVTWSQQDNDEVTGNPLGSNKNLTFKGSGELDNGWSFGVMHAQTDAMSGLSSSSLSLNMGSLGTVVYDSGAGGYGLDAMDNVMPTAFEEADHGLSTGMKDVGSLGNTGTIHYKFPEMAAGVSVSGGYNPRVGSGAASDGSTSEGTAKSGWDIAAVISSDAHGVDGLEIGLGIGNIEGGAANSTNGDKEEETIYAKYAWSNFTIGYQISEEDNEGKTSYETDVWGVSFNVNDDLSISYQYGETEYVKPSAANVTAEFTGWGAAYNWGGMAIKYADSEGKNHTGTAGVTDNNKELSISMAF